jgi:hypothetical protein
MAEVKHLKNIEEILTFIDKNTDADTVIETICDEVQELIEHHITYRDVENFIAYFKLILSSTHVPKEITFDENLVMAFINRTYAECTDEVQMRRVIELRDYLQDTIPQNAEITNALLDRVEERLMQDRKPDLRSVTQRIRIGLVLKWLQGPLEDELSPSLKDYFTFLATIYGQYKTNRVINVDWLPCDVTARDKAVLHREYTLLEKAIKEAIALIKDAQSRVKSARYQDEFRIVLLSLDNLVKKAKVGGLNSVDAFKDKVLVASTLMYVQDNYVEKDMELNKLIQLFVSLYRQFRDKHYEASQPR